MSQELMTTDFVMGNQEFYDENAAGIMAEALTTRETIMNVMDRYEDSANLVEISQNKLKEVYSSLVAQFHQIPSFEQIFEDAEAEACDALFSLASLYWHYNESEQESREQYMCKLRTEGEDSANEYMEDCIGTIYDWIVESEYYYCPYKCYEGVVKLLEDLNLPFTFDSDTEFIDWELPLPPNVEVVVYDAQEALFPNMVTNWTNNFSYGTSGDVLCVTGVVRRVDNPNLARLGERSVS